LTAIPAGKCVFDDDVWPTLTKEEQHRYNLEMLHFRLPDDAVAEIARKGGKCKKCGRPIREGDYISVLHEQKNHLGISVGGDYYHLGCGELVKQRTHGGRTYTREAAKILRRAQKSKY
jgi:hypothetical protein